MAISICDVHTGSDQRDTSPYGSIPFPLACYEDDMRRDTVPVHWHDGYEYIVAMKGTVTVLVNAEEISLSEGDCIFINSGCLHGVKSVSKGDSLLRSMVVLPKFIGGSSDGIIFRNLIVPFTINGSPSYVVMNEGKPWQKRVAKNLLKAWSAVYAESYDFENEARYLISRATHLIADNLSESRPLSNADSAMLARVKTAIAFIEENYGRDIGAADLTAVCGCSESALLRSFKQAAGISPMQFLINFRIQKAAELLLTTEYKSNDIAESCGFNDFSYFTKLFKRTMGTTPIEYRKTGGA